MGCDCHFAIEVFVNGKWKAVAFKKRGSANKEFYAGKRFRVVEDDYLFVDDECDDVFDQMRSSNLSTNYMMLKWVLGDVAHHIFSSVIKIKISETFDLGDIFDTTHRDYKKFAKIAGVRNSFYCEGEYIEPRRWPRDVSKVIKKIGYDHTPTHFYPKDVRKTGALSCLFSYKTCPISNKFPNYRIIVFFDS